MVGEFGVYNQTPHRFALSWMNDTLAEFKKAGWGWALWNFTGSFGICDSGRFDVAYETWHGRKLDRAMLELLQTGVMVSAWRRPTIKAGASSRTPKFAPRCAAIFDSLECVSLTPFTILQKSH